MAEKVVRVRPPAAMWAASLILPAGRGSPLPPYVQTVGEYQPDLNSEITITTIEICYNKSATTSKAVKRLADNACAKEGTHAAFDHHRILHCPLLYPVSAIFVCR